MSYFVQLFKGEPDLGLEHEVSLGEVEDGKVWPLVEPRVEEGQDGRGHGGVEVAGLVPQDEAKL